MKIDWEDWMYKHPLLSYALEMLLIGAIILGFVLIAVNLVGCGAEPKTIVDNLGDGTVETNTKAVANQVWPWVVTVVSMPVLFLLYLFWDKRFTRFGRV